MCEGVGQCAVSLYSVDFLEVAVKQSSPMWHVLGRIISMGIAVGVACLR